MCMYVQVHVYIICMYVQVHVYVMYMYVTMYVHCTFNVCIYVHCMHVHVYMLVFVYGMHNCILVYIIIIICYIIILNTDSRL